MLVYDELNNSPICSQRYKEILSVLSIENSIDEIFEIILYFMNLELSVYELMIIHLY